MHKFTLEKMHPDSWDSDHEVHCLGFVIIFLFEIQKLINTQKCEICQIQYIFLNIKIIISTGIH